MTEQDFPFEAFSVGEPQAKDVPDTSFVNEFNDPETPPAADQVVADVEDPTLANTDHPAPEPANGDQNEPPAPTGDPAVDTINKAEYEKVLAEKAEIEAKLAEMKSADLDENSKKIYDYIREGKLSELKEFLDIQTQDFASKSQTELLKDYLKASNPEWSNDDIDDVLSSKYGLGLDEDLLSDQDKRAYSRELKADAKKALEFFESKKANVSLPDLNPKVEAPVGPSPEEIQADLNRWDTSVTESLKDFQKLSIALKENEQFDFAVDEKTATELTEDLKALGRDVSVFFKPYIQDGKINSRKLAEDMAFLKNKESIVRSAVVAQVAKAQEDWLKSVKNTNLSPGSTAPVVQAKDDTADFIANNIF